MVKDIIEKDSLENAVEVVKDIIEKDFVPIHSEFPNEKFDFSDPDLVILIRWPNHSHLFIFAHR